MAASLSCQSLIGVLLDLLHSFGGCDHLSVDILVCMKKIKVLVIFSVFLILLIASCSNETSPPTEVPKVDIINLQIVPSLTHWLPDVANCSEGIPYFGVHTQILPQTDLDLKRADLILRLGQRQDSEPHAALMGIEKIGIVIGNEVPLTTLSIESLRGIFFGTITNWNQVPEIIEQGHEIDQPIQTLSYPDGHSLRQLFSQSYLEGEPIVSDPILFSTAGYGLNLIQDTPFGVAYLLERHVREDIQTLTITDFDPQLTHQYVLAITPQVPQGKLRQLLLCLQNAE